MLGAQWSGAEDYRGEEWAYVPGGDLWRAELSRGAGEWKAADVRMNKDATPNAPITVSEHQALVNRVDALEKAVQELSDELGKFFTVLNQLMAEAKNRL